MTKGVGPTKPLHYSNTPSASSVRQKRDRKVIPQAGHEGTDIAYRYGFTFFFTITLDGVGSECHAPAAISMVKRSATRCCVDLPFVLKVADNLAYENIVRPIKSKRLSWLGHVERMPNERVAKTIYKCKPYATRQKGRPRLRWENDARNDLRKMGVKNWKQRTQEKKQWKEIIEEAKNS
jgi:hypothetical protein